ncbi:MAG: lipopolysaccharide heptosyltransferase II [Gemmatimonadales bacterium]
MTRSFNLAPDILVVRFSAIGDLLLVTPLLRALRARHPGARIALLTKEQYVPLMSHNPNLNEVFGIQPHDGIRGVARQISSVRYTHLLDLHGSLRTLALRKLAPGPWSRYSKQRLARALLISTKRNFYHTDLPVAERYFEAAAALDVKPDEGPPEFFLSVEADEAAAARLAALAIGQVRPLVAIAPGAAHATKRWPVDHWVELTQRLTPTGADVVVVGGPGDVEVGHQIVSRAGPHVASTAGSLGLQQTGAVIRRASAVISGDTGLMHMATAVGTPVVAIFGPTVRPFGFFPYRSQAVVMEQDLACRPCSAHGGQRCPLGHHLCLRATTPEDVFTALCRILA